MKTLRVVLISVFLIHSITSFAEPPAQSGPYVQRGMYPNWFWYSDGELLVIHGLNVIQSCIDQTLYVDLWDAKLITHPREEGLSVGQLKGDVGTWIHPWGLFVFNPDGSIDDFGTCVNIFSNPGIYGVPLASGSAKVVLNDNNTTALQNDAQRGNAWHLSAHGFLNDPNGGQVFLTGGWHCKWSGDISDEVECRIRLMIE